GRFLLPLLLLGGVLRWLRGPLGGFWRRVLWLHLAAFALHLFVTFPGLLGLWGSRGLGTRGDERAYAGPRLSAAGELLFQDRDTLRAERDGKVVVDPAIAAAAAARARTIPSSGGVTLRAFRLEARHEPPVAVVVMVHGLFRSALELERPAAMLRDLGCECWLLELRNHGGSSRAPFSGGLHESDDVVAAVQFVRAQADRAQVPVGLFGVSLGTIAVALATPRIERIAGLVLDSPMEDLGAAADRMLQFHRPDDRRSWFAMVQPWRSLVVRSLETWSHFRVEDASPITVLATMPTDVPVLIFGGGKDDRAPPDRVTALFDQLPMPAADKRLWIRPESGHGDIWKGDPTGYAERLAWWVANLRR
ncbi:MAG: alpha/beta fold hydrolase, partial [Planctomycetes bacterium]|nr:alpha/beta fold hydrolase [Planctomycetota bacterium]